MEPLKLPGPKARAMMKRDSAVISPSYPRGVPFVMDHGRGTEVWDVDGNRFLDFAAGIAVASTGHSHPKVVKAIQDQAEKFLHISSDYYHESMIALGEKLNTIAPFHEAAVSFMCNSGTEAVETAIKLARYHTGENQLCRLHRRVPWAHDGRSDFYGQQTNLSPRLLSAHERRRARPLPQSLPARAGTSAR